ncbi:MAG: HPF/RaiA family ribosome-associated protein [Steroidobacteraceae bacterium]
MRIDIQSRGFQLTAALRNRIERRLRFALGPAGARIRGVLVRLTDQNGPRGGIDKRCMIRATLGPAPPILIRQEDYDLYVAIDHAAARLGRTVLRQLARLQDHHPRRDAIDGPATAARRA